MDIAARIKRVRDDRSQRDMAKALGCSLGALQSYETGKSIPGGNVLEAFARMGVNVNWLLTGVGPREIYKDEIKRLLCEEAHADLKKRIWERRNNIGAFITETPNLTREDVEAYASGEKQLTKIQLIELCKKAGSPFFDDEFIQKITSVDLNIPSKEKMKYLGTIDKELLRISIEVVEEMKYGDVPMLPSTKAALINLIYVLNRGTEYNKDRLESFIGAAYTLIHQGFNISKLSDELLDKLSAEL